MQNLNVYKLKLNTFKSRFILNKEIIEYDVKKKTASYLFKLSTLFECI